MKKRKVIATRSTQDAENQLNKYPHWELAKACCSESYVFIILEKEIKSGE